MTMINTLGNAELIIHHTNHIDIYAITSEQLELLRHNASSEWRGHIQTALSILTTSIINMMALGFDLNSASFRMNIGLAVLSLSAGALFTKFYLSEKRKQEDKLRKILNQPIQTMHPEAEKL